MTAPPLAEVPDNGVQRRGSVVPLTASLRALAGPGLILAVAGMLAAAGQPAGFGPPALVAPIAIVGALLAGLAGGLLTVLAGVTWAVIYYGQPVWSGAPGTSERVLLTLAAGAVAVWLTSALRDRADGFRTAAARQSAMDDRIAAFTGALTAQPEDALPDALINGAVQLVDADMGVVTILEPRTGRHFVRAVYGSAGSAVGIEVLPGTGITGQAIRERQMVSAAPERRALAHRTARLIARRESDEPGRGAVIAVPCLQQGRVVASLTMARANVARQFTAEDEHAMARAAPIATLAVAAWLSRNGQADGTTHDTTTGLYNRSYLDSALEQLLALRRRSEPAQRPPLSMILFDIDSFASLNQRHGRPAGDQVLRAAATLLRQRFRASDIIARVGPDSFLVVLYGGTADIASQAAAQIRRQAREFRLRDARGEPIVVSMSAGCVAFREGEPPDALFRSVEAALATARWSGPGASVTI